MPIPEADPSRLFALGALFGMPQPDRWRVLEIGCGAGGHLVPMAARHPDDRWLGFDLAGVPVQQARALSERLGSNAEVLQLDVCEASEALAGRGEAPFDAIVAHGVYSWVPDAARTALLDLCGRWLAPHGIAYVSANCLPGWGMRGTLGGMLRYVAGDGPPERQTARARAFVGLLCSLVPENDPYGAWLRREEALIRKQGDPWLFHDLLAPINRPVWLHELVDDAASHGMQYLGDAVLETMLPDRLPQDVQARLASLGGGQVQQEQLLDFVLARSFRRVLLCRDDLPLQRELVPEAMEGLHVVGRLVRDGPQRYRSLEGDELRTDHPLLDEVMGWLADHRPASAPVDDLARVGGPGEVERVRRNLLLAATRGLVELRQRPAGLVGNVSPRPLADPIVRILVDDGEVPTALGAKVRLDGLEQAILRHLDGGHDVPALVDAVLTQGFQLIGHHGMGPQALRGWLEVEIPRRLAGMARTGLLVA